MKLYNPINVTRPFFVWGNLKSPNVAIGVDNLFYFVIQLKCSVPILQIVQIVVLWYNCAADDSLIVTIVAYI